LGQEAIMKRWDVLGFGAVAVDDLIYLERYPEADEKVQMRGKARDAGGMAGTALVTAAKLGAPAAWAGVLGFDDLSVWTLEEFVTARVDTEPVIRFGAARPIHSIVLVERAGGTRTILYSFEGVQQLTPDEVSPQMIAEARVVFLDHTVGELSSHILKLAREAGVPTVADLERLEPGVAESVREVDHLIVGRAFATEATGEKDPAAAVRALGALRRGLPLTAVTADGAGYWWIEPGAAEIQHRPALSVDVVDTTGCGDVFHGAYAAQIAHGASPAAALEIANVAAGLKATRPGGRRGIPSRADVEARLAEERLKQ
jgi:sulfofructose kinase